MMTMRSFPPTRGVMSHLLIGRVGAGGQGRRTRDEGRVMSHLLIGRVGALVARLTADRLISLAGSRRGADQIELIGAGHGLAADRPLQRLPEDPVPAEFRERV